MAFFIGIVAILTAAMLLVAAFPMALMACGFVADSGKCSTGRFWTVLWLIVLLVAIPAAMLTVWGWNQLS